MLCGDEDFADNLSVALAMHASSVAMCVARCLPTTIIPCYMKFSGGYAAKQRLQDL
jgi:hypothetical protein